MVCLPKPKFQELRCDRVAMRQSIEQHPDWVKYKAESEAGAESADAATYIGEVPKDDDNFFMAKLSMRCITMKRVSTSIGIWMDELKALLNRNDSEYRLEGRLTLHAGEFAEQLRKLGESSVDADQLKKQMEMNRDNPLQSGHPVQVEQRDNWEKTRLKELTETAKYKGNDDEVIGIYLSQFDDVLSELVGSSVGSSFPVHRELASGPLPHLSTSKSFAIILSQSAKIKLARKDGEGAMENLRLTRLTEALAGDDPIGLCRVFQYCAGRLRNWCYRGGVQLRQWTDAQLQEIEWLARRTEFTAHKWNDFAGGEVVDTSRCRNRSTGKTCVGEQKRRDTCQFK